MEQDIKVDAVRSESSGSSGARAAGRMMQRSRWILRRVRSRTASRMPKPFWAACRPVL